MQLSKHGIRCHQHQIVAVLVLLEGRMQPYLRPRVQGGVQGCSPCFAGRSYATYGEFVVKLDNRIVAVLVLLEGRMQQQKICSDSINIFPYGSNDHPYLKRVSHFS